MIVHELPMSEDQWAWRMTKGVIKYVEMIYGVDSISIGLSALSLLSVPTSSSISTDFKDNEISTKITKRIIF
jgi:hypothetical protein